jgi:hypothetical protein
VAKEAAAGQGSAKRATRKTMRKLEKVQSAFHRSERRVGKLRIQLERAEVKLAERVQKMNALELQLHPAGEPAQEEHAQDTPNGALAGGQISAPMDGGDGPVVAYKPLAGSNGAGRQVSSRGKKAARGKR